MQTEGLESQLAIIIGASGAVGSATANLCLDLGMRVFATYCSKPERISDLKMRGAECVQFDLATGADELIKKLSGQIPFLVVNCASRPIEPKRFEDFSEREITLELTTGLIGPACMTQSFLKYFGVKGRGTIIHVLSHSIETNPARMALYTASKAGLKSLIKSIAKESAASGIRIIGLSPTYIESALLQKFPKKMLELERERRSNKMLLQPREVAEVIVGIAVDSQQYQSGEIVNLE